MTLLYKILSFLMIPIALLFGLMGVIIFFMAISTNPAFLLMAFALICYVIYCITCLQFLVKVLIQETMVKASLRDWIKVNAYGTAFIAAIFMISAVQSFNTSDITLRQQLSQMLETQPQLGAQISVDVLYTMFKSVSTFLFVVGAMSITHVIISFKLMKKYADKFISA
jgi:hypothetical protein